MWKQSLDSCIITCGKPHHVAGVFCLLGDHPLPLHDQMDWGGFGEKVQVSHHTPFYWLHLRKTNKTKQLSSLGFMYWNIMRNLSFLSEGSWLASVYTWFGLLCSDRHCVDIYLVMSCSWVITLTKSPMVSRKIKAKYVLHVTSRNMNPCTSLTSFKYIIHSPEWELYQGYCYFILAI